MTLLSVASAAHAMADRRTGNRTLRTMALRTFLQFAAPKGLNLMEPNQEKL